jgi:leucyl aminopeptidase
MPIEYPVISVASPSSSPAKKADTAVLVVYQDKKLGKMAKALDKKWDGIIEHQLESHPKFTGECGQTLTIALPEKANFLRVVVLGLGDADKQNVTALETAGGKLADNLAAHGSAHAALLNADDVKGDCAGLLASLTLGLRLGCYRFDGYKTVKKDKKEIRLAAVTVMASEEKSTTAALNQSAQKSASIAQVRDLVNEPPNKLYPSSFASIIQKTLTPLGVKVTVIDSKQAEKLGMGCLIAVGQASENPPCMVVMEWAGVKGKTSKAAKKQKPLAFVGKGITFDCGGLNVKPYEGMLDMKMDMAGAATVVGLMKLLATRKCMAPVVGIVALAENAISDEATRPSDIVTSYSGKTVEILNTDAEGRLVLADALTYVQKKYDPKLVIDLATLTGAIMISLGLDHCGAFVNDNTLWSQLESASQDSGEKIWRMPLDKSFRREMDSVFADIRNVGNGRYGGSCTAAAFLSEFIDEGRAWAHLDIAGVAMSKTTPTCPVPFASGYGVRLLNQFVEKNFG